VSNPFDVVRTRIMNERVFPGSFPKYSPNPFITLWKIFSSEGLIGLYKGFVPSYTRMGTCTSIVLVVLEQLRVLAGLKTL